MIRNPSCTLCPLHASSRNVCIYGDGDGDGFLIGEAPGEAEGRTGRTFQGQSGQLLRPILADFGIEDSYITNIAKCRPPKNRKPEPSEIKACRVYLDDELETRQPKAVLLMGAPAMKAMIGRVGITEMNGQVVEKDGRTYVCSFHPAYILRDPSKESALRMAIGRYAAVLKGTHSTELPPWQAIDASTFDQFLQEWAATDEFTFDTETTGLEWWVEDFKVNCVSFSLKLPSVGERNWVLPLEKSPVLPFVAQKAFLSWLSANAMKRKIRGIAQNGKFDNLVLLAAFGVTFHTSSDTMLAHHLIDENSHHGLKLLARQFLGAPDYDLSLKEKKGGTSPRKLFGYCAADSAFTRRLDPIFVKKMDADERWLYENVIIPASRAFVKVEANGLFVDLEYLNNAEAEARESMLEAEKRLNKMAGKKVNWNAPGQVAEILYGKLKLTPTVFTDGGAPSTGEAALVDITHPIGKLLEEYRGHEKFLSTYTGRLQEDGTYVGGWRDFMVGPHLYLSTKLHGTVTGRYSSRLHSTPRDGAIRNAITAPPPWKHGVLDLSQAELRVIAITSKDSEMLRCFKAGEDIHWRTLMSAIEVGGGEYVDLMYATARHITKRKLEFSDALKLVYDHAKFDPDLAVTIDKTWKEARKKAKGINFGFCFDQSPQGFIGYAKLKYGFEPTLQESMQYHAAYFDLYNRLPAWHERQRNLAKADGFVRSMSGRKRRLPGVYSSDRQVQSEALRQAINSPIQGFIGDYKAMILVELMEVFSWKELRITGEVHDSILFWYKDEAIIPEVHARALHPRLAKQCGLKFPIEMAVDIELGAWGAGRKWRK